MKNYLSLLLLAALMLSCSYDTDSSNKTDAVNVFIGTGGHGHTFPGATTPYGMVQLSPDTRLSGWDACGGYHYSDHYIHGFTHTHLSGTGIGDYGDISFMPVVGKKDLSMDSIGVPLYKSAFSHEKESARPGYYQVLLQDDSINVELTTTQRAGMHRYTFPTQNDAKLIIDMGPTLRFHKHPDTWIKVVNDSTVLGLKFTSGWAKKHYVYFYAIFSKPFDHELYSGTDYQADVDEVRVDTAKAVLSFKNLGSDKRVLAKVGISSVDEVGAKRNLMAEIPDWNFDHVVEEANATWNKALGVVDIESADENAKSVFYSALYHTMVHPSIASDVDGRYRTMGKEIKQDKAYTNYTIFSLWDTFRAAHPMYTVLTPAINQAFIRSMLRKYDESGLLPKWELASNETGSMIGYHAVSVIGDAIMKDQCDFDMKKALEACVRSSVYDTTGIHPNMNKGIIRGRLMNLALKLNNEKGYVPCDKVGGAVSQGLEYAYNNWIIAELLKKAGSPLAEEYVEKGKSYLNYFDPSTRMMRGRLSDGSWETPFDPVSVKNSNNYVEGNAWQWTWFVPQDVDNLIRLLGGEKAFAERLDTLFTMSSELTGDASAISNINGGMIGQYAHSNEPSHHIPYLYNFVGQPYKTQALVDYILRKLYTNTPDGLSGNEDVGQMSAWYVLNAMGFYSFCPGKPMYEIGRPLFDKVTIHLENGKDFVIEATNNSVENKYVQSMSLNGIELKEPRFSHFDLMKGGTLKFRMGKQPLRMN